MWNIFAASWKYYFMRPLAQNQAQFIHCSTHSLNIVEKAIYRKFIVLHVNSINNCCLLLSLLGMWLYLSNFTVKLIFACNRFMCVLLFLHISVKTRQLGFLGWNDGSWWFSLCFVQVNISGCRGLPTCRSNQECLPYQVPSYDLCTELLMWVFA